MQMNDDDKIFIAKRARLIKAWPIVGAFCLCLVLGFSVWMIFSKPHIANPFVVLSMLKSGAVPSSSLTLMAALQPIYFLICLFLLVVIVLLIFMAIAIEKKYMAILRRMDEQASAINTGTILKTGTARQEQSSRSLRSG
jgi:hypothetical protein